MVAESPDNAVILYPDTNSTAVVVCKSHNGNGRILTIYNDVSASGSKGFAKQGPEVLVMFNGQGIGGVNYPSGKPWLVVTAEGWSVSDPHGKLMGRGKHPRDGPEIRCEPTPDVAVSFTNKQKITVSYTREGQLYQWEAGEVPRFPAVAGEVTRKSLAETTVTRRATADTGLYPQPPPNSFGSLRTVLKTLMPKADVSTTIQGLEAVDARVKLINTLPVPSYGTSRTNTPSTTGLQGSLGRDQGTAADQSIRSGTVNTSSPLLPDYGKPPMSSKQRRWQKTSDAARSPPQYQLPRTKLDSIKMDAVEDAVLGKGAAPDTLYCLCLLADFNPACAKVRPQVEGGWHILQAQAGADPGSPAHHIKVLHVDASEDRKLQKKFNYRSVPMYLMFYCTRLVYASNNISTKDELVAACLSALEKGRRGESLPEGFAFGVCDNTLLDHITPTLSLRGQ